MAASGAGESCQREDSPGKLSWIWAAAQARYSGPYRSAWRPLIVRATWPRWFSGSVQSAAAHRAGIDAQPAPDPGAIPQPGWARWLASTCRVAGRVRHQWRMVRDLARSGHSLLLLGPPGVGKNHGAARDRPGCWRTTWSVGVVVNYTAMRSRDGGHPHPAIGQARAHAGGAAGTQATR